MQVIGAFVFIYAKSRFSLDAAHMATFSDIMAHYFEILACSLTAQWK